MTGLEHIRQQASRRFSELGFPTTRNEEWRFTNVARIAKTPFAPAPEAPDYYVPNDNAQRLVFINGRYSRRLSTQTFPRGVRAVSLQEANGAAAGHIARYASFQSHAFVALNTASFDDGACIEIADGIVLENPIELLFVSTGADQPVISHPRSLIVIGRDCQATIVERYAGSGVDYFTNAVTEIVAGEHAIVDHYKVQLEDERSFHISSTQAQLGRDANFVSHSISLGGGLVRNDVNAVLSEGTEATVNGFYLASGSQHVDNHTSIDHALPHGTSHELYKGILSGKSAAVFNGKIIVRPGAQKTDAKQTNKNLVLSEDATINTKPELQIHADDVRCTHGATIGQLDQDAIFYMQSRGIARDQARDLLIYAFTREILDRVKVAPLRVHLEQLVWERLHATHA
jgi:Fe-S cluster assembly protein SufD